MTRQTATSREAARAWAVGPAAESNSHVCFVGEDPMADEDLKAELERLKAENERLKNRTTRGVSLKVSEKGAVSV